MPSGNQWANVIHIRKTTALTYTGAIAIADPLITALFTTNIGSGFKLQQYGASTWKLSRIRYTPLDGVSATTVIGHPLTGTSVSDPLPSNVALVATLYTGFRGRSRRGRIYTTPWAEDANTGGALTAAYQTQVQNQFTNWLGTFTSTGTEPVVASYKLAQAFDVVSIVVNGVWDTQRRRNRP